MKHELFELFTRGIPFSRLPEFRLFPKKVKGSSRRERRNRDYVVEF